MALPDIDTLVKEKLAFIPATDWQSKITVYKVEQMYYLNTLLNISEVDTEIEDESNWTGMKRYLLGEITAYQLILHEIIHTLGGEEGEKAGSRSKLLKKGKADVAEAEFEYAKAEDGRTIAMKIKDLLPELKNNICRYAKSLDIIIPGYCPEEKATPPPFFIKEFE